MGFITRPPAEKTVLCRMQRKQGEPAEPKKRTKVKLQHGAGESDVDRLATVADVPLIRGHGFLN